MSKNNPEEVFSKYQSEIPKLAALVCERVGDPDGRHADWGDVGTLAWVHARMIELAAFLDYDCGGASEEAVRDITLEAMSELGEISIKISGREVA